MPIFRVDEQKLRKLHIAPLGKERDLQRLLEANLVEALGVRFLASEYVTTMGSRIDTLGVDVSRRRDCRSHSPPSNSN